MSGIGAERTHATIKAMATNKLTCERIVIHEEANRSKIQNCYPNFGHINDWHNKDLHDAKYDAV